MHYDRFRSSPTFVRVEPVNVGQACSIAGCTRTPHARRLCGLHYQRLQKTGSPIGTLAAGLVERFWAKVAISDPEDCWEWTAARRPDGYGRFVLPGNRHGRAHIFSYELHRGAVPDGAGVLHSCDNPPCVNPRHLSVGTQADNMGQMADRRRWPRKLTDDQMMEVRDSPGSQAAIAQRFGISQSYVSLIKRQYRIGMHRTFTA